MSGFAVRGWCPDAWRPMAAGDGLLLRVQPPLGRLTCAQMRVIADVAAAHGNGLIDLTSRANLQLRGVRLEALAQLLPVLVDHGLVDADSLIEAKRGMIVAPGWREGDDSWRIGRDLVARLPDLPFLPGKVGFVIDAGSRRVLGEESGDFRIERARDGGLILRADGRATGMAVAHGAEADALVALAHWFVASGGAAAGRMARHDAPLPAFASGDGVPAPSDPLVPGAYPVGFVVGVPFGRITAAQLAALADGGHAVRITPGRSLLVEDGAGPPIEGLITDPADPLLRVDACPGRPSCGQSSVETRALARRIAPYVRGRLHVSGCAKGCARAAPADVVLTGREGRFDLSFNARAGDPPTIKGLTPAQLLSHFGAD